jgi:hypothetical protein
VFIPLYVVWKVPLYLALLVGGRQKKWERTARQHEERGKPGDAPKPDAST